MQGRNLIISAGNCVQEDAILFQEGSNLPEAVAACQRCPEFDPCRNAIADIAIRLAAYERNGSVIGGEYIQWRVERPVKSYESQPSPMPDNGQEALDLLRKETVGERLPGGGIRGTLRPAFDTLLERYDARDHYSLRERLGGVFDHGWSLLAQAVLGYRLQDRATILSDHQKIFALADCYFRDIIKLGAMEFSQTHLLQLAVRHSPDYFTQLFDTYADHPDLTPARIRKLVVAHDMNYPACAIEDYLLRLTFFRRHYKEVPNAVLKKVCMASDPYKCGGNLESWRAAYQALRQDPSYRSYDDWLLQHAALLNPKIRKRTIQVWNTFFQTRISLDYTSVRRGGLHETVAGTPYYDPEDHVLRQEAASTLFLTLLARLSQDEQDAVAVVYGLEPLLDREPPDEAHLMAIFNASDLALHVDSVILPKLRYAD